jgi:hypothetical protein
MGTDVFERGVERADAVRLARDERVNRDRHDARHCFAFAVQRVELALTEYGNDSSGGVPISNW